MRPPKSADGVPQPRNVSLRLQRGAKAGSGFEDNVPNEEEGLHLLPPRLEVYWTHPESLREDKNSVQIETKYEHIQQYEIETNLYTDTLEIGNPGLQTFVCTKDEVSKVFENVPKRGEFVVRIRTVATNGAKSPYVQRRITINPEKPSKELEPKVRKGGVLTTGFDIDSSNALVEFTESTYNFTPAESGLQTVTVTGGTTAQTSCSFSNLASGNTGYLLWDYSDTTDPLKAIEYIIDTTSSGQFFRYAKNLDADTFTQKTGTVTIANNSAIVTGTGTARSKSLVSLS